MTTNQETNQPKTKPVETTMSLNLEISQEKTNTAISPIDLQLIGNNMLVKGKEQFIKELAKSKALFVPFEKMAKKYPQLEAIKALTAFKIFCNEENKKDIRLHTISLMCQDDEIVCVLPDFNQTIIENFDLISMDISDKCAIVRIKNIPLVVNVLLSEDGLDAVLDNSQEEFKNSWLSEYKIYGNKLETIPKGKYTAILNGKQTENYNSPMANLTSTGGKEFNNIVCNQILSKILKDGKAHTVVIADTITTKSKSGQSFTKVELYED